MKREPVRGVAYVEIYCESQTCPVRESRVTIKVHSEEEQRRLESGKWFCPSCKKPAKIHWQRTLVEQKRAELKRSIAQVNAALYEREAKRQHGNKDMLVGFPLNVFIKTLPEEWKAQQ